LSALPTELPERDFKRSHSHSVMLDELLTYNAEAALANLDF
jgi:hypothetical protein